MIHIDIEASEIGRNYPVEIGVVADAKAALKVLRNDQRDYKVWAEGDSGEAVFEGTATLKDGSTAMLLRQDETILVKPRAEHDPQEGEIEQGQNVTVARNGAVAIAAKASRGRR